MGRVNCCRPLPNNMAEPQVIQKPGTVVTDPSKVSAPEPVIRTMPEKYIGAAAGKPPLIREIVETKVKVVEPPPPPKPPAAPAKKSNRLTIIVIVAAVLLAGIGTAVYIILTPAKPVPPPVNKNVNLPPVNVNTAPPPPPVPVCGNGVVETGEACDIGSQNGVTDSGCSATCQIAPKAPPPPPNTGIDSDSDGLTDVEETTVYGTNPLNLDTDGDTFNDGNEVSHLYDPNKKAPAMLKDSSVVKTVTNATENYSVLVPAKWALTGENSAQFLAAAPSGEFFEVLVTDKPQSQSLVEWYLAMSPGAKQEDVERVKTLEGYDALRSPDRLTTYIDSGDGHVFTLTYSFDDQPKLEFRTTYEAFVGSFILTKK